MENELIPGAESPTAVRSYVTANKPNPSALAEGLWVLPPDVLSSGDRAILFDQYKLYVAEAERLSVRRTLTSAFLLVLNVWLAVTLVALGVHNLPLAAPALFNIGYHLHSRRVVGWAFLSMAVVLDAGLFVGSLIFLASGQSFEQFRATE